MKRKCNKCHKLLPLTSEYFCKCSRCSDNLNYQCKSCIKEYQIANKKSLQQYQKQYQQVYQAEHKIELNAYQASYQRNKYHNDPIYKERLLIKQRAYNARKRKLKKQNDK
jgi:hypothetical protein